MTLDEAIRHAEEVAKERNETANLTPTEYGDYINSCRECANEHEQLAEWLKDYKRLLEERPQGHWCEMDPCSGSTFQCSECGGEIKTYYKPKFCEFCGANMRGGEKNVS